MPSLWDRLKRPLVILLPVVILAGLGLGDLAQPAERQLSARAYLALVSVYQKYGRPFLEGRVACRYRPTCSEYSQQAVARLGIVEGLRLTVIRVSSCRPEVPAGTPDPVPAAHNR